MKTLITWLRSPRFGKNSTSDMAIKIDESGEPWADTGVLRPTLAARPRRSWPCRQGPEAAALPIGLRASVDTPDSRSARSARDLPAYGMHRYPYDGLRADGAAILRYTGKVARGLHAYRDRFSFLQGRGQRETSVEHR